MDANNKINGILPSFNSFSDEFPSGSRLINIFSSWLSSNQVSKDSRAAHIYKLNECILHALTVSQIRYSLVVILELSGVSEVQYKDVMMIDDGKYQ